MTEGKTTPDFRDFKNDNTQLLFKKLLDLPQTISNLKVHVDLAAMALRVMFKEEFKVGGESYFKLKFALEEAIVRLQSFIEEIRTTLSEMNKPDSDPDDAA